MKGLRWITV